MSRRFNTDDKGYVHVYTDGACLGNGRYGATAGIGVWFADGHPLNVSKPIPPGFRATNQVAEILAVTEAAKVATRAGVRKLMINTDSKFIISCVLDWIPRWKCNGWRRADGREVVNKHELIEMTDALDRLIVAWNHVSSHSNNYGNEMADQFARDGAIFARNQQ